ncbi:hypothetical protein [Erwinia pyrifoliae]|nr:hypothetical protein [Erwinia pyrifoliae]CAY73743.1 hypothetical protein EPYR_01363 [Erwinia pyrifoliae DSM 12163]AUX73192.1 hypothetical protein CPI84_12290 [Erwinia pyrifoliae]MCA8876524.1 hypothetical protein [Erwinia pyrifoliae]MCT2386639.1 hypothetical protein [Erwinia pyrifoliae]UXK11133.1 hypothetical protein NYP80_12425 [Erwinia pyrifoliae]
MTCRLQHRYSPDFGSLPYDQSKFNGRHKCAGCAYEKGFEQGRSKAQFLNIDYTTLPNSQAGTVRHKSVQAAFAKGYFEGVLASYQ